jgi:16S rRNA (guanine966-N2)-methyltransferase
MSIVQPWIAGARVVDLCAGSGALGLEALSRGAAHATFVEQDARVRRVLHENIAALGASDRSTVVGTDVLAFVRGLATASFELAFADPPYASPLAAQIVQCWETTPFATRLGVEHAAKMSLSAHGSTRRYGDTAISFFSVADPPD